MSDPFALVFKVCTHFTEVDPYRACLALVCFSALTLAYGIGHREGTGKEIKSRVGKRTEEDQFLRLPLATNFQINPLFFFCALHSTC